MNILKRILGLSKKSPSVDEDHIMFQNSLDHFQKELIHDFQKLNTDDRLRRIMAHGDTGALEYFKLLQYAILFDPNLEIKFAALKRFHLFKNHPDLLPLITGLKDSGQGDKLDPYFSMALSRLEIISVKEFEDKINSAEKT